jgi:hypothetical protein
MIGISIVISFIGSGYEIYHRRKERKVLTWEESQLIKWLLANTQINQRLVIFENNETRSWGEMIPPITGRMVYSLYPHAAEVYSTTKDNYLKEHYVFPIKEVLERSEDFQPKNFLLMMKNWLIFAQPDFVIFRKQIWCERDQNPFAEIFKQLFPEGFIEIGNFVVFDFTYIKNNINRFDNFQPKKFFSLSTEIINRSSEINLSKGLYLVEICTKNDQESSVDQEIEVKENYKILRKEVGGNRTACFSRLFFAPEDKIYMFQRNLRSKFLGNNLEEKVETKITLNKLSFRAD